MASPLSLDAKLASLALAALKAATAEAVGAASGLPADRARAALEELRAAGVASRSDVGTWTMPAPAASGRG